jgi:hypothetical protein
LKAKPTDKYMMKSCPVCENGRFLNFLAKDKFFCMSCLNEFSVTCGRVYIMEINENSGDVRPLLVNEK